jgi:hypothetical protein
VINLFDWVEQLTPEELPPVPWLLHPSVRVIDNSRFLFALQQDAKRATSWRARFGVLHNDMRRLHAVLEREHGIRDTILSDGSTGRDMG